MPDLVVIRADLDRPGLQRIRVSGGTITEVGPDLETGRSDLVVDAAGGAVLPGLHDHHVHLYAAAAARHSIRVGPPDVVDRERLAAVLSEAHRLAPPGSWIRGIGYHESVGGPLDRGFLDTVLPERPARIQHRSGAQWILNTAGLEALSVGRSEQAGVERDASGAPTGRLYRMDRWLDGALARVPLPIGEVAAEAARRGVTGFTDATPFAAAHEVALLSQAKARGELPQRVSVMSAPAADLGRPEGLSLGPVKILLDDTALPAYDELREVVAGSHRAGRPVAVHCVTRVQTVLTASVLADAGALAGDRIEHGAVIPAELLGSLAALGVTVVTNPGFLYERGDSYASEVDPADLDDLYRCASLREAGVPLAAGTDSPFGPDDPWTAAAACVTRRSRSGTPVGPGERLDARDALALFLGSAGSLAEPRTISPGAPGDLCVLLAPRREAWRVLSAELVAACVIDGELVSDNR